MEALRCAAPWSGKANSVRLATNSRLASDGGDFKPLSKVSTMSITITSEIRPFVSYYDNPKITDLPFVADKGKGKNKRRSFWNVKPNGDYGDECLIGKFYALECLQYAIATGSSPIAWIIPEMPQELTGIEIGFLSELEKFATIGAASQARASS